MRTAKYENHKVLCRKMQAEIEQMEGCKDCVVMFNDSKSKQLFTIAYAEDDDFISTNQNLINVQNTKIKAL